MFNSLILFVSLFLTSTSYSQERKGTRYSNLALSFVSQNSSGEYFLYYQEPGRSSILFKQLLVSNIDETSVFWMKNEDKKSFTFTISGAASENKKLLNSLISYIPLFSLKTIALPESIVEKYKAQKWIPVDPSSYFVTTQNALYSLTQKIGSGTSMLPLHISQVPQTKGVFGLAIDSSEDYVLFSYFGNLNQEKILYSLNIPSKKFFTLNTGSACKENVKLLNGQFIKLASNQIAYYCSALPTGKPGFIVVNVVKGAISSFETKFIFDNNSSIAIEDSGSYMSMSTQNNQVTLCSGNIKEIQSTRCTNVISITGGKIFTSLNVGQFLIINSSGLFLVDKSTLSVRKSPISLSLSAGQKIIGPISL